jgi:hypothetical protein
VGVRDSRLDGPGSPTRNVALLAQGKRCVLVPDDQPVVAGRLVEQCGAERYRRGADKACRDCHESGVVCNPLGDWNVHQVPGNGTASFECRMLELSRNIRSLGLVQDIRHDLEAVCYAQVRIQRGCGRHAQREVEPVEPVQVYRSSASAREKRSVTSIAASDCGAILDSFFGPLQTLRPAPRVTVTWNAPSVLTHASGPIRFNTTFSTIDALNQCCAAHSRPLLSASAAKRQEANR